MGPETVMASPPDIAAADPKAAPGEAARSPKRWRWITEERILNTLFRTLLATTVVFLALDFQTIYEQAAVPLPGETHRLSPLVMEPPKERDQVRPYLPRATPIRRSGDPPQMPGFAQPPKAEDIGAPMAFVRGPNGQASAVGRIEIGTASRFSEFIDGQAGEVKELFLHSPGGSVQDALAISKLLRANGIATQVPGNAYCASSCPIVLSGGEKRTVGSSAWIGVHRIYAAERTPGDLAEGLAQGQAITAEVQAHLVEMGVDARAWLPAMQTPSEQLYVFTEKELTEYKLATRIAGK